MRNHKHWRSSFYQLRLLHVRLLRRCLAFVTFPFLACCRRFYAYKVQIHPATIARYFEFNAVFFETFSLPVPSYPINKAFPWPVFLDFVPNSVIPNEGVAVVKILVFNFPLICLNSCSDKYPQKTLSLK